METTAAVQTLTDELLEEIEAAAISAGSMALDTAEVVSKCADGQMIECPVCGGEGYASAENDYCNFDNHAIGVEFYGIGPEFGAGERYFRAASPATITALITEIRTLRAENAELRKDAGRGNWLIEYMASARTDLDEDLVSGCAEDNPQKLRDAIDTAMEQAK
jgi:hypothetical protein